MSKNKNNKAASGDNEVKPKIRIKVKAFDHKIIDRATKTIIDTAKKSHAQIKGPVPLPTEKTKYTVNRSTFVHKDARDQFEMRVHKRLIDIYEPKSTTINDLTNLALPSGVDIEIKM
ncbi:30S ribosomal protein S10 [Candidatus Kuenenbacteria bacterium RIFCSPLOWO2_12_FULL_42_13]|uniref:Small ribosomal subunit protein uS10 n=4 Tax=Candidatus Kueneniibacteriota TaxID=1752740 RepID=A0A1F6G048_9BACT|nr:MAG: 30S ribosomal protein S10 [Candidatus Kuenenbacteria bacterium RIFCSPHIGHO2_02_FULL_42_29]OGG89788.1 MAG: 30S ribosomal protein S10 [Candidatus Kuenenbacteria bacterium RIFCSPLOWO2_02_FULL_42_16]OGG91477.1 MAG: 30S ribosomal protein S10 [Candidatus Kuenenbacteria bacterium RIFCSPLOWO2_12_FULL_42_13]OGG95807.1 MAG: 30S ribosomal protein S10 [Candidatus Kuenenbacteria bacterium RBG_16_41_7]OGH01267.1 MAG: 30S ribosomal protein S10 [Candidatus Kuenenbacteria bacterium RIFCSPHIGHO2_12_FULL_